MAIAVTIGTVPLAEIHDLGWPTDRHLVQSFRTTLQRGGHFAPMQLNRVWQPDVPWRYEIIDGFHRYEAAKAEGVPELLCQVVELGIQEARYDRIQACVGKPAELTRARALQELRLAFILDMHSLIGSPTLLYEPILGEDGRIHARPRTTQLPTEPLEALEVFTDHLRATDAEQVFLLGSSAPGQASSTRMDLRAGWEPALLEWLTELGRRFGYDAAWLLQELHMHLLQQQGFGQDWTPRQREAFQRQGGYAFHALWLWNIPDVELRVLFRRQIQTDPGKGEWLWKSVQLLGLTAAPQAEQPLQTLPKSVLQKMLTRYPSPRDLYQAIRNHLEGPTPDALPPSAPVRATLPPPAALPAKTAPSVASTKDTPTSAIFAVASPSFVVPQTQPKEQIVPVRVEDQPKPDPVRSYEPVHQACITLLHALQELTRQYGKAWLHWEHAQEDVTQLRKALAPD
jgi:hypothetical protein